MTDKTWESTIELARQGNDAPFNAFVNEMYISRYHKPIFKFTGGDEALTREVYTNAITKFWERFILRAEPIPQRNISGYVFNMARNAFIDIKRQVKRDKECEFFSHQALNLARDYASMTCDDDSFDISPHQLEQEDYEMKMKLLHMSISQLDEKCQEIINRNVYNGEFLKDLKLELGFTGTYQSIVEKKKRCIRRLSKLMFKALESVKSPSAINSL